MRRTLAVVFIFYAGVAFSQPARAALDGKVTSPLADLEGIYIRNLMTENTATTDKRGYFSIAVAEGDSLMFSSVQFKGKTVRVTKEDLGKEIFFVGLEAMINPIEEVRIIRYNGINAVSLGIIPKGQKKFTPAERRLETASKGSMTLDPLINSLSGRTAMLRKELAVEKKEALLSKISQMFEESYFIENLKIPELYVRGFWYYAIENKRFADALNAKNKFMAAFLAGELAAEYRKLIGDTP